MFVADLSPLAFTASMNSGKIIDGMICAGWRIVRSTERRASTPTWVRERRAASANAPIGQRGVALMLGIAAGSGSRSPAVAGALRRRRRRRRPRASGRSWRGTRRRASADAAAGRRPSAPLGVERADDVGERLLGLAQPDGDALRPSRRSPRRSARARLRPRRGPPARRDRLERRAPDLGLQLRRACPRRRSCRGR